MPTTGGLHRPRSRLQQRVQLIRGALLARRDVETSSNAQPSKCDNDWWMRQIAVPLDLKSIIEYRTGADSCAYELRREKKQEGVVVQRGEKLAGLYRQKQQLQRVRHGFILDRL
jgi:hypothetical protein